MATQKTNLKVGTSWGGMKRWKRGNADCANQGLPPWISRCGSHDHRAVAVVVGSRATESPRPAKGADRGYQCETRTKFLLRNRLRLTTACVASAFQLRGRSTAAPKAQPTARHCRSSGASQEVAQRLQEQ